jgi:hypothetical protein
LKFGVTCSISPRNWIIILWRFGRPNLLALNKPLSSVCLQITFRISFSQYPLILDKRLLGDTFWGNLAPTGYS